MSAARGPHSHRGGLTKKSRFSEEQMIAILQLRVPNGYQESSDEGRYPSPDYGLGVFPTLRPPWKPSPTMMNRLVALITGLAIMSPARAHQLSAQSVTASLAALRSKNPATRMAGYEKLATLSHEQNFPLCSPLASAAVKQGLIAGLRKEGQFSRAPGGLSSEHEVEDYYPELIACVASLHDTTAIPDVLAATRAGGGPLRTLGSLGDAAVPQLLALIDSGSQSDRAWGLVAAGYVAADSRDVSVSAANRIAIRVRAFAALDSKAAIVRAKAIEALGSYFDPEVRRAITNVAQRAAANRDTVDVQGLTQERLTLQWWFRQDSLRMLNGFAGSMLAQPASANAQTCVGPDSASEVMLNAAKNLVTNRDFHVVAERKSMQVPVVDTATIVVVTDEAVCSKLVTAFAAALPYRVPGSSGRLYVIQVGSVYYVRDPAIRSGEWPVEMVIDNKWKALYPY
jgi:hypothetical protein